MPMPLFSVVIPTYGRSELVTSAIHSALAQTCQDVEVVVCDNHSPDDTREVVQRLADRRVRYVRPPRHLVIADNWEFARREARGRFVLMLSDDDALTPGALARFASHAEDARTEFLFCATAYYYDQSFLGPGRNTLECVPFTGESRVVTGEEFVRPLFAFRGEFILHPSAFVFAGALAARIAERCGRFFQTNGVEFCAWPLAAMAARRTVFIDRPMALCGRTGKSWGSNMYLTNPGRKRIEAFLADVDRKFRYAPLKRNHTGLNMQAEGILTAKALMPAEFAPFELDEAAYLVRTWRELQTRRSLWVDVSAELEELYAYARAHPGLLDPSLMEGETLGRRLRKAVGDAGARDALLWYRARRRTTRLRETLAEGRRRVERGEVRNGFRIRGEPFGFQDILGAATWLERVTGTADQRPDRSPAARADREMQRVSG